MPMVLETCGSRVGMPFCGVVRMPPRLILAVGFDAGVAAAAVAAGTATVGAPAAGAAVAAVGVTGFVGAAVGAGGAQAASSARTVMAARITLARHDIRSFMLVPKPPHFLPGIVAYRRRRPLGRCQETPLAYTRPGDAMLQACKIALSDSFMWKGVYPTPVGNARQAPYAQGSFHCPSICRSEDCSLRRRRACGDGPRDLSRSQAEISRLLEYGRVWRSASG